jgi:DNA-binding NarL/FixJ family response regulator
LALSPRHDLFAGPCESLIFGESPPAYAARARTHLRGLTNCEQEILDLVSDGQSNEVIAATLFISVRIVEHHVCAIPSNRRASTRERTAREAIKLGLTRSDRSSVAFSLDATDNE